MPEISGNALVMIIQAVDEQIHALGKEIDEAGEDVDPDLQELHFAYVKTAWELKEAYEEALQDACNLPPYHQLVRDVNV